MPTVSPIGRYLAALALAVQMVMPLLAVPVADGKPVVVCSLTAQAAGGEGEKSRPKPQDCPLCQAQALGTALPAEGLFFVAANQSMERHAQPNWVNPFLGNPAASHMPARGPPVIL